MDDTLFCDDCGEPLTAADCRTHGDGSACSPMARHWVGTLPVAVSSASAGESAVLCADCLERAFEADPDLIP